MKYHHRQRCHRHEEDCCGWNVDKQKAFVQAYTTPGEGYNNATQAAVIAGYSERTANNMVSRLLVNVGIKAEIAQIRADLATEAGFTREQQLKDLELAKTFAVLKHETSGMVSAIREQNEMLGYHRELAPNTEKEAEKAAKMTDEEREFARIAARMRGNELAEGGIIPFKSKEAG